MRVTAQMIVDSALRQLERSRRNLLEAQDKVSTGRSFTRPSQNPLGAERELKLNSLLDRLDQFNRSVTTAKAFLQETERALGQAFDLLIQAKNVALAEVTATSTGDTRAIAAQEASAILAQLAAEANSRQGDRHVFGGFKTGSNPFDGAGTYSGDSGSISVRIGPPNESMVLNFAGDSVFKGAGGGVDIFTVLTDLQTSLTSNDTSGINTAIAQLEQSIDQIISFQTQAGIRLNRLDAAISRLDDTRIRSTEVLIDTAGADLAQAAADLINQQTLFDASLAATARILQTSFFSFLA